MHDKVTVVVNRYFIGQKGFSNLRWQGQSCDAQGRKETGRKRLDIEDMLTIIQIVKRQFSIAIKVSQIVVFNDIDIITFSKGKDFFLFLTAVGMS